MFRKRSGILFAALMFVLVACQGLPGTGGNASSPDAGDGDGDGDYLQRIRDDGVIVVSTDPEYPPQSFLDPDTEEFDGFDIGVAREIAERLGVEIEFVTPEWDTITAGSWSNRWDMSVGSMTVTTDRLEAIDFTQPYYYVPAEVAVPEDSDVQSLEDLEGELFCVGAETTYLDWLEGNLTIDPETAGEIAPPPDGAEVTTLDTDIYCADAWRSGRTEFEAWASSATTIAGALFEEYPIRTVGDPVFFEPLAVAFDRSVEDNDSLVAEVDRIIGEMHEDGTLAELSRAWFCVDGSYPCENPEENGLDLSQRDD